MTAFADPLLKDEVVQAIAEHHDVLLRQLTDRVAVLRETISVGADWEPALIELAEFLAGRVLWHAEMEERVAYPLASGVVDDEALVTALRADHQVIADLTDTLINAQDPGEALAAADAACRRLERHLALQNRALLPTLRVFPAVTLAALLPSSAN